ncbi:N-acetylmuramoyl-L-alanine amidase [Novosphingobium sp. PC22D]|uniref:N-acetylmuramoyl-L-alanine amidase family protein n=1 Tax=Novosphingobium sp. PC22D TaxID=1962403 RepID=UPI000BF07D76|nr:N-acetylmuramoyl-L-alanine amidase [Novosphingobium sp. PC22D]PEQ10616.1 N-acetylmuramoyl-L-alanine amidase [Novosphingobium sp. PC22D]
MARAFLIVLLVVAPLAVFLGLVALDRHVAPGGDRDYVVRIAFPLKDAAVDLPRIDGPPDATRPLVVIDPGHGGFDPGAGAGDIREKDVALAIAKALRARLLEGGGIRVAMTREDDRFITLGERPEIARKLGADLFVSIHADSAESNSARGASVYVLSERGTDQAAARLAERENSVDVVNGVSLSSSDDAVNAILLDLSQREAQEGSVDAARLVLREADGDLRLHRGAVQAAALAVLKAPDIPSILFETGYINNAEDGAFIASDSGQRKVAQVAARAIRAFFARRSGA